MLLETLDILSDLIRSYGNSLAPFHDPLVKALMPLLVDPKPVSVRKRAYTVLCEFNTVEPLSKNEDTFLIRTTFLSPSFCKYEICTELQLADKSWFKVTNGTEESVHISEVSLFQGCP